MSILQERAIPWVLALAFIVVALAGVTGEAAAQVFQGPLAFNNLQQLTMTVTLQPTGAASYTVQLGNFNPGGIPRPGAGGIDSGFLVANVAGSAVTGFFQSTVFPVRACFFRGNFNGTTATLRLDPVSCGNEGTLILTRIA